ncbi:DUF2254 domain-containing protein [Nocardia crassostreae]|uniref:DUF2254 domain-containing protein n=1 Tax=Nocardia crassostreae TaxID=53428 RepID=UPI000A534167|nr:DUF2254 domain-containing protein [Nocardia crassostreae]
MTVRGEKLAQSFLIIPAIGIVGGGLLGAITAAIEPTHDRYPESAEQSLRVIATVGPAMLTFLGVVFSITLVALQMASGNLSPRIVRLFVRSHVTKATLAIFLATFVYTVEVQYLEHRPSWLAGLITMTLATVSMVMFVVYINEVIGLMRLTRLLDRITHETLAAMTTLKSSPPQSAAPPITLAYDSIRYIGSPGVLRRIDTRRLTALAAHARTTVHLDVGLGDFLAAGTAVCRTGDGIDPRKVLRCLAIGPERSMRTDVAFGLRQLVDIAIRALSPAINDPTTAVQVLDRIEAILAAAAPRPLGEITHRDKSGAVRVVEPSPDWDALVELAFAEILINGRNQPQVVRRMIAAVDDLIAVVAPQRTAMLTAYQHSIAEVVPHQADLRRFYLQPDRQGIGWHHTR